MGRPIQQVELQRYQPDLNPTQSQTGTMQLGKGKYLCALLEFLEGRAESGSSVSPTPTYSQVQCKAWPTVLAQETWIDQTLGSLPQAFLGMPSEVRPGPGYLSSFISPFLPCACSRHHPHQFIPRIYAKLFCTLPCLWTCCSFRPRPSLNQVSSMNSTNPSFL